MLWNDSGGDGWEDVDLTGLINLRTAVISTDFTDINKTGTYKLASWIAVKIVKLLLNL